MTNELILDLAIIAAVAVFVVIGFIRGIQREVFVTAAVLGGWAMASAWTPRWSERLADLAQISERTSGFIVTSGLLIGSMVILGWGAGLAVGSPALSSGQRFAGAVIGGINAVLLASYALETYTTYLSDLRGRELIDAARIARAVRDDYGYALAAAMALAVILTIIALAVGGSASRTPLPVGRPYPSPPRIALPESTDDDFKVEPTRRQSASAGFDNTMPIVPVDSGRFSDSGGRRQPTRFQPSQSREWTHIPNSQATAPIPFGDNAPGDGATSVACVNCGANVTLSDVYCPHCGKLTR